jgi:hypothetical protein
MFKILGHENLDFGIKTTCKHNVETYVFFNIHLDDMQESVRQKQMNTLVIPDYKCVIAGDFNQLYHKYSAIYNIPLFISHNYKYTYNNDEFPEIIDNILTKNLIPKRIITTLIPDDINDVLSIYGSDHIHVVLVVE